MSFLFTGDGVQLFRINADGSLEDKSYGLSGQFGVRKLVLGLKTKKGVNWHVRPTKQYYEKRGQISNKVITTCKIGNKNVRIEDYVNGALFRKIHVPKGSTLVMVTEVNPGKHQEGVGGIYYKKMAIVFHRTTKVYINFSKDPKKIGFGPVMHNKKKGWFKQIDTIDQFKKRPYKIGGPEGINGLICAEINSNKLSISPSARKTGRPLTFKNIDKMILSFLTSKTGLVMAGPEWDDTYQIAGGYEFVWPRDLYKVFTAIPSKKGINFFEKALIKYKLPPHRIHTDGTLAPGWCNDFLRGANSGYQHDQLAYTVMLFAKYKPKSRLFRKLATQMIKTSYQNGFPKPGVNAWEDHYGHLFSSTTGTYLQAFLAASSKLNKKLEKQFQSHAHSIVDNIDRFWNGEYYFMGLEPRKNIYHLRNPPNKLKMNDKLDSATFDLIEGLIQYQKEFGFRKDLTDKIIKHISVCISKKGLYQKNRKVEGLIRYKGDTWQQNPNIPKEKIWSVTTLEGAIMLGKTAEFLKSNNYNKKAEMKFRGFQKRLVTPYKKMDLIPEQFFNNGEYSSACPLAWSHALRLVISSQT